MTTMDHHDLLAQILPLDDPDATERAAAQIRSDPEAARQLALLRQALAPLEADRDQPLPPPNLVSRTLGRIAEHLCASGQKLPSDEADMPVGQILAKMTPRKLLTLVEVMDRASAPASRWRRADIAVAGSVVLVFVGLLLTAVVQFRQRQATMACQNQMREYHGALQTFSEMHNREFPRVTDSPPYNTAAAFLPILRQSGTLSPTVLGGCPSAEVPAPGYAYSLGYREA